MTEKQNPAGSEQFNRDFGAADAVMIAEGVTEAAPEVQRAAWQYLVDTGLAWKLQGWFGRRAAGLLELGELQPAERADNVYRHNQG